MQATTKDPGTARSGIRHRHARVLAGLVVAGAILSGCTGAASTPSPAQPALAMGQAQLLNAAGDRGVAAAAELNQFGLDLLSQLGQDGNLCASPTSVALALAMVRPGARGQTAAEMDRVLHGFGADGQASEIVALLETLSHQTILVDAQGVPVGPARAAEATGEPLVELDVADQAFAQSGENWEPTYLDALSSTFGAGIRLLNYKVDPEAARRLINQWAGDATKGRIPDPLQPGDVTTATRLALANAIYLKAAWDHKFDPDNTRDRTFTTASGTQVSVPTMALETNLQYAGGSGFQAVELPYTGDGLSMLVVIPADMNAFVGSLTAAKLDEIVAGETEADVDLTLPRFSLESRFDLSDALVAMGMPTAFDSVEADFSGMTKDEPLFVDRVVHAANIDVVEEGTTAAAVTIAMMAAGASPAAPPHVIFHADKPFMYFIRERSSGAILFMGRVNDPSQK
jgi:serpin B